VHAFFVGNIYVSRADVADKESKRVQGTFSLLSVNRRLMKTDFRLTLRRRQIKTVGA
jgi:hypothetical protein